MNLGPFFPRTQAIVAQAPEESPLALMLCLLLADLLHPTTLSHALDAGPIPS